MNLKSRRRAKLNRLSLFSVLCLFTALLAPFAAPLPASAATYRNFVAQTQPIPGQPVRVWVNSDTAFGETAGLEYLVNGVYTKVLGTFDNTTYPGANWRIDIPGQPINTFVQFQLFTRNQSGSDYGFTGFNWNYSPTDIHWNGLLHDTFNSNYRSPFGAQPAGSNVTIRFRSERFNLSKVTLVIYQLNPDHESSTRLEKDLPYSSNDGTYDYWQQTYTLPTTPTIWYYKFKLERGTGTPGTPLVDWYSDDYADDHDNLNQGGTGAAAHSEPNQSFQLTVYNPSFQTPAWMQNAFVYQIFPDRFRNGNRSNDPDTNPRTFYGNITATYHSTWNEQPEDGRVTGNYNRDFFGGDLQGIINKLDYLKSLGVTAIYMTPIVKAESNHRYDTDNYEDVDPYLGDPVLFQGLVTQAQQHGIKLILDGVYNHTSSDSLYFDRYHRYNTDGACESTSSFFRPWYRFTTTNVPCGDSDYEGWFGYPSLAVMDKSLPAVRDYIFGGSNNTLLPAGTSKNVTQYWYDLGAAGFRFDVADDATFHHNYWQAFRSKAKPYKSDGPLIGEIWPDASPWLLGDELDSVMNYRFRKDILGFARYPFNWADNDNNGSNSLTPLKPSEFDRALKSIREDYPPAAQYAMMNLVDSHDTNRSLFVLSFTSDSSLDAAKARQKLVATFQFTYIGAPTVYYGDEAGLNAPGKVDSSGVVQDDPYNRAPFPWNDTPGYYGGQDLNLTNYYSKLAYIRSQHSALRTGDFRTLLTDDTNLVYSFGRSDNTEKMVVALNNNTATVSNIAIPVSGYITDGTTLIDALTGNTYTVSAGKVTVSSLGTKGAVILSTLNTPAQTIVDTTITQKPNAITGNTSASFSFSATVNDSTFECSLDNAAFSACTSQKTYNGLSSSSHTFGVRAVDPVGNTDPTPATYTWTIDTAPPDTSISAGPTNPTGSTSASFSFASTKAGSTFECKLDGGAFTACTSPTSYTVTDGSHTFQVRAIDQAGNIDQTPASYSWVVDTIPPTTSITAQPALLTSSPSASFSFTSSESGSTFQCKLDGGNFASCSSPVSYSNLSEGNHTFQVRAIDAVGNIDPGPASYSWTIDTTPPDTNLNTTTPALSNSASASFSFASTENNSTFQCKLDNGAFAACTSPFTVNGLSEGGHSFSVKASDPAGNADSTPATFSWTVDTTPPVTTITAKPNSVTNSASASFSFSASETSTFVCSLDSASFATCASGISYTNLADGAHSFTVRATDAAGNTETAPQIYQWTVDTVAPVVTIDSNPATLSNSKSASFTFHASEPVSGFQCKLDSGNFAACASGVTYTNLADGSHSFTVKTGDAAGNSSAEVSYSWTIDTVSPLTVIDSGPAALTNQSSPTFVFHSSKTGSTFQCSLDSGAFATCSSPATYTNLADGSHSFKVKATDPAGNTDPTPPGYTWTVDTQAPTVSFSDNPPALSNSKNASFSFAANESGSTFQCSLDTSAFAACSSPASFSGLADGSHTFSVKATDAAGNTGPTLSYSWKIDTVAPTVNLTAKPNTLVNSPSASFSFTASETDSTFQCKLDSNTFGPCAGSQSYSNLADGVHSFMVKATDAAGNTGLETSYSWTVDTIAPEVIFDVKPGATSGRNVSFAFHASEAGSNLECQLDGASFATCNGAIAYTGLTDGSHTFEARATDQAGNVSASAGYSWTVDATPPTVMLGDKPAALTNSATASFSFSASEAATFQCKLDSAAYQDCTSPYTANNLSDGTHTVEVKATDNYGNSGAPQIYSWTVDTIAPAVTLSTKPAAYSNSSSPNFGFTASETGSTLQCSLDNTSFSACTSPVNYSGLGDGSHTFKVKATDSAGNTGDETSYTWTIDTIKPIVTITAKPNSPSNSKSASFSFSVSEANTISQCSLDGAAFADCARPVGYSSLGDGSHTFKVKATDQAGNTSDETSFSWTIDTVTPMTSLVSTPPLLTNSASANFSFSSSKSGSTFQCSLDNAAFTSCSSPANYSGLSDGNHNFKVRAVDGSGNLDPNPASYSWTIDTTPPVATITTKPAALTSSQSASFSFSSNETGSTFQCQLDNGVITGCASGVAYNNLKDGSHSFAVTAIDQATNSSLAATYSWTVDTTPPTISFVSRPADPTKDTSASFSFIANEVGTTFQCSLDNAAFATCSSPASYSGLTEGSHTFVVKATDPAGNTDNTPPSYTWTVDTTAPTVSLSGYPSALSQSSTASFSFSPSEAVTTFECSLDNAAFAICSSPISYSGLKNGNHSFRVRVTDLAGNTGQSASYSWTVDATPPQVTITGVTAGTKYILGNVPVPGCTANDTGSESALTCSGKLTGGNANGVGNFTYTATATDSAGNTTTVSVSYKVIYGFSGFLPPLNNGNNATNVAKAGSTVPVKFQLKRADGSLVQALSAKWLTPVKAGTTSTPVSGSAYTDPATSGGSYTWDGSQYIYLWGTAKTDAGYHWRIGVTLDDEETYYVIVDLR
jgi:glycosidase